MINKVFKLRRQNQKTPMASTKKQNFVPIMGHIDKLNTISIHQKSEYLYHYRIKLDKLKFLVFVLLFCT